MYLKDFEVRWSDIDANRHLANSAYQNMMSHARMDFLTQNGFTDKSLIKHNIGPVVFYEHIYYFKEILPDDSLRVSTALKGLSDDGRFFEFEHNFYNQNGKNCARAIMMGSWIDMKTRRIAALPDSLLELIAEMEKTEDFKSITKEDTRKYQQLPVDLPAS